MEYHFIKSVIILFSFIPISVCRFLGRLLGTLFSFIPMERSRVVTYNLRSTLGSSMGLHNLSRLKRRIFIHFGEMFFELPHIMRLTENNLNKYMEFINDENLLSAIRKNKGVFLLTGHFGNWELVSVAVAIRYGNMSVVARPFDYEPMDRLMDDFRTRYGTEVIPKQRAMRRILKALKQRRMVGILLDQNVDWYEGVFIDFLGRPACTNKGLALMALKTNTPVIPTFSIKQADGRYKVIFGREMELKRSGDRTKDVEDNTKLFTGVIEDYVRKYPDQWFWFHKRWKTLPYCTIKSTNFKKSGLIPKSEIKNILIRATNWVGDMVITLPALEAVRKNFPESKITLLARPWVLPMLEDHPSIDNVIPYEKGKNPISHAIGVMKIAGKLRKMRFDCAILFQNALEAALVVYLGGIRYRIGYNTEGRGILLSHSIKKDHVINNHHQVEYYLNILRAMGWEAGSRDPVLTIDKRYMRDLFSTLENEGVKDDDLLIGLSPGAIYGPAKRWPAERFAQIGDWAIEKWGAKVVVLGSQSEADVCSSLCGSMTHSPLNYCGKTTLGQAMALIKRCQYFVTNDSGLMHVAAALGVPLVAIFGSTDPVATGPRSKKARILRQDVDCAPCLEAICTRDFRCMLRIEPEHVWKELESLKEELR